MSFFKPIPDEGNHGKAHFVRRKIRTSGDSNLLAVVQNLLARFEDEGDDMLVSEMGDLVDALHRSAILVQKAKQKKLLRKLRRSARHRLTKH
ncbi:MAG: hypothetical protein K9L85_00285 [Candidatus Peribacteraceae bacterium]|nr:hypothetical protein [Candidatus Peribacteraceae bacterium]